MTHHASAPLGTPPNRAIVLADKLGDIVTPDLEPRARVLAVAHLHRAAQQQLALRDPGHATGAVAPAL